MPRLSVIVSAVNDGDVLRRNLGRSPDIVSGRLPLVAWVKYRQLGNLGYCSSGVAAMGLPFKALAGDLGVVATSRLFKRHILGWI